MKQCPSIEEIERLLSASDDGSHLSDHIKSCKRCQRRASRIRDDNRFLVGLHGVTSKRASDGRLETAATGDQLSVVVAGYEILSERHRGGQGIVYEAIQIATKRIVALKMLLPSALTSTRARIRFKREIEIIAKLRHPNIVTLYDSGFTADGQYYYAMEYIRGVKIDEFVRRWSDSTTSAAKTNPIERIFRLFIKLCEAVQYAYQHGIVHRDLKPGNILVDSDGELHVLDFGLAKAFGEDIATGILMTTQTGEFMGTFAYAAPEQVRGAPQQMDTRTDVYALGVILYEMLTDTLPYPISGSLSDVIRNIAEVDPAPPSVHRRGLDNDVDAIVLKALSKDRDRRYPSAESLRRDLLRYLAKEPIDAKRDSHWYVLKKTIARYKAPAAAAASLVVLLVAFSVTMSLMYARAEQARLRARAVQLVLEDAFSGADLEESGKPNLSVFEAVQNAAANMDTQLSAYPEVRATLHQVLGAAFRSRDELKEAEQHIRNALELRLQLYGENQTDVAESLHALGAVLYRKGEYQAAVREYQRALEMRKAVYGMQHSKVVDTLRHLAGCQGKLGEFGEAVALYKQALNILEELPGDQRLKLARTRNGLAALLRDRGQYAEAAQNFTAALGQFRDLHGFNEHSDIAKVLGSLGDCMLSDGRCEEARKYLKQALDLKLNPRVMEQDDLSIAKTWYHVARLNFICEPYDLLQAEEFCQKALGLRRRKKQSETHDGVVECLNLLDSIREARDAAVVANLKRF